MAQEQLRRLDERLRRYQVIDECISSIWNEASKVQIYTLSQTPRFGPWYNEHMFIAGSQIEGGLYARMFENGKHVNEVDSMLSLGNIQDPTNQLQPIQEAPGHFKIRFNGIRECFHADDIREKVFAEINSPDELSDRFLARPTVTKMVNNMFISTGEKTRANEWIGDYLFQPPEPCKAKVVFKERGPSAVIKVILTSAEKHFVEIQVDNVACFKLSSWPDDFGFEEFQNRKRKWPSNSEDVESIQDMVHIVPKSSPNLKEESERKYCWRLSFSEAETHLMSLFSDGEKRVYLLFKILFYAHIKEIEINKRTMASYFCKTTMLWMMEELGAELCKKDVLEVIQMLFGKFKQFLDNGFIPNFFYPSNNLIEGYPEDLITKCSAMAGKISESSLEYVPSADIDDVCDHLEKRVKRLDEVEFLKILNTIKTDKTWIGLTGILAFYCLKHGKMPVPVASLMELGKRQVASLMEQGIRAVASVVRQAYDAILRSCVVAQGILLGVRNDKEEDDDDKEDDSSIDASRRKSKRKRKTEPEKLLDSLDKPVLRKRKRKTR